MYEVTYSVDGIVHKTNIQANDYSNVYNIITNMFGVGKVQILNVRRI